MLSLLAVYSAISAASPDAVPFSAPVLAKTSASSLEISSDAESLLDLSDTQHHAITCLQSFDVTMTISGIDSPR